jgi:hypothetical protein
MKHIKREIVICFKPVLACYLLDAGILFSLFSDCEDGGDMFLRNVGWLSEDITHHNHGCENLKSYHCLHIQGRSDTKS